MTPMVEPQSPNEIFDMLLEYWEMDSDAELAKQIEVSAKSVNQARGGKRLGIKDKIIIELLRDYRYMEDKLEKARKKAGLSLREDQLSMTL